MNREIRILFAGGGTGGHVFPAIYIAQYLKKHWGARCQFIGTKHGIESIKVPQSGFVLKKIWISGLKRGLYLSNLLFPLKIIVSLMQSKKEIRYFKPDIVIGTGGYVSGQVKKIINIYHPKLETMLKALEDNFPKDFKWSKPEGGMFVWVEGPEGMDMEKVYRRAIEKGVGFVPGKFFFPNHNDGIETMRLNFTNITEEQIKHAIKILASVVNDELKITSTI